VYADSFERVGGQIAAHYEQAGLIEQAIIYYQRAAEGARRVYAHAEALATYEKALRLLETPFSETRQMWRQQLVTRLHEQMGDVLAFTGRSDEAREAYQRTLSRIAGNGRHTPAESDGIGPEDGLPLTSNVPFAMRSYCSPSGRRYARSLRCSIPLFHAQAPVSEGVDVRLNIDPDGTLHQTVTKRCFQYTTPIGMNGLFFSPLRDGKGTVCLLTTFD
jgi:hypothetical protein